MATKKFDRTVWHGTDCDKVTSLFEYGLLVRYITKEKSWQCIYRNPHESNKFSYRKRAEICERYDKKIRQAEAEKKIILCVFDYGLSTDNVIYYSHTNTLSFNWGSYEKKITQEEFDDFVNKVDRSQLPEDIRFELK